MMFISLILADIFNSIFYLLTLNRLYDEELGYFVKPVKIENDDH